MSKHSSSIFTIVTILLLLVNAADAFAAKKKVYMSYILHGNMNYDRYVRPTIWRDFPIIYDNLLDFMDKHPDFKGQLQFSGQTLNSMRQAAPEVLEHAMTIHKRGQLNFTGTFYSEPVNVNMDGETNYRCAWLGTKIVEDFVGQTDGFYLQERAYHPQLPWILNNANVSWTPVITGDDSYFPFRLQGMDGSESVCVPITRQKIVEKIKSAPENSLIVIEEDYEIPSSFTNTYSSMAKFNAENNEIEVEWITVKEYIQKFGIKELRYVDHSAKATNRDNGTYSRWTADPLDIIVQNHTNQAMADFRSAKTLNALMDYHYKYSIDEPYSSSDVSLIEDPLIWNIERAELYPDVEPKYLARNGSVTLLSKAEHLLLWAVNSDSKGWFPLYEKRRERINSFENSCNLSQALIYKGMDWIGSQIKFSGYDKYFMVCNLEPQRHKIVSIQTEQPYEFFDYQSGQKLNSQTLNIGGKYSADIQILLPSYGYTIVAAKHCQGLERIEWQDGNSISAGDMTLTAQNDKITLRNGSRSVDISFDSFQIKALAEVTNGKDDGKWRDAKEYGSPRISVKEGLYPQLRVERQLDWLLHVQQTYTITNGHVVCDVRFVFPHPTLIRKVGEVQGNTFDPRGLNMLFNTNKRGEVYYDIPFGISRYAQSGESYFCPLSTCFLQNQDGGFVVSPQTGEQAFAVNPDTGLMTLFLGASTTSGPISEVDMTINKNSVHHRTAWYSEPFHGEYHHQIVLYPYSGDWRDAHIPSLFRSITQPVYVRECYPQARKGKLPVSNSWIELSQPNIEITSIDTSADGVELRINEKEGRECEAKIKIGKESIDLSINAYGIKTHKIH